MMNNRSSPSPSSQIQVVIVDDHEIFRDGLLGALLLEDDIQVIGQTNDGSQAVQLAAQLQPDVVITDVNLPSLNGLQVTRQLKTDQDHIAVVILTGYHDQQQELLAMRAGASAYCPKDISRDKLIEIIRDAARGSYVVGNTRMSHADLLHWMSDQLGALVGYAADPNETLAPLSPREMEILDCVTNGLSNKEIAARLDISQQTVKNHMTSILRKLNVQDRTQAAVSALRHGWVRLWGVPHKTS